MKSMSLLLSAAFDKALQKGDKVRKDLDMQQDWEMFVIVSPWILKSSATGA